MENAEFFLSEDIPISIAHNVNTEEFESSRRRERA